MAELVHEKKSLSIVLQQEKQRSLYDIEQERQISLSEIKAIKEKHNNSIARERKHPTQLLSLICLSLQRS